MKSASLLRMLLAALAAVSQGLAQGRDPTVIPDAPSCARCTIQVTRIVTLGDADGPGSLAYFPFAVRADARGRFWVISENDLPRVYAANGAFLREVGRKGRGPGEFAWPSYAIPLPGDSVLVLDANEKRGTVVGPDLIPGRTILTERNLAETAVIDWPNLVIMNGDAGPLGRGWGLHRVSFAGRVTELSGSFGPERVQPGPFAYPLLRQHLSTPHQEQFWSADPRRYRLTHWTAEGTKLQQVERKPSWFAEPSENLLGRPSQPPQPGVTAIEEDSVGRVWVFVQLAAPTWREGWPAVPPGTREIAMKKMSYEKLFRTTIEVIDPVRGRVVARRSIDEYIMAALPNGRAAIYSVDTDGVAHISVVSLTLTGAPP